MRSQFFILILTAALLAGGCAHATQPTPAVNEASGQADARTTAPPPSTAASPPPGAPSAPHASPPPSPPAAASLECEPYTFVLPDPLAGRFVLRGDELSYLVNETETTLLEGPALKVFGTGPSGVLLTDGEKLFWFDSTNLELKPGPALRGPLQAAYRHEQLLLAAKESLTYWRPGAAAVTLQIPDHLFAIYGVSISPDGRYGVAAFDLDIQEGPRAGVIWAYDLTHGTIAKWPAEEPKVMAGLWLLGWSGDQTVRFMTGQRGYNIGHTWALTNGEPPQPDKTEYRMMERAAISPTGSWFAYRPAPEQLAVQSVQPDSRPQIICRAEGTLGEPRILLNGHIAFYYGQAWWELEPSGQVTKWEQTNGLY